MFLTLSVSAGITAGSGTSSAHLGHGIASGERRIELTLGERDVTLGYSLGLAAGPTRSDLERAHATGEDNVHLDALTGELLQKVVVCSDGTCRPPQKQELESVAASGWGEDTLTLEWRFRLRSGGTRVAVEDRWDRPEIGRTDVAIRPLAGRPPLRAGPDDPKSVELEFAFDDRLLAGAPRVITVVLPPEPRSRTSLVVAGVLVAAAIGLVLGVFLRQRAREKGARLGP